MSSEEEPVAWLRSQILERKAVAVAACGRASRPPAWVLRGHPSETVMVSRDIDGQAVVYDEGTPSDEEAVHIALNDPRDVLARCEAELAILDEHYILYRGDTNEKYEQFSIMSPPFPPMDCGCVTCHYASRGGVNGYGICRTVKFLVSGYRHRPGYREEDWKPGVRPWKAPSGRQG